jgi:hypothetical protein
MAEEIVMCLADIVWNIEQAVDLKHRIAPLLAA